MLNLSALCWASRSWSLSLLAWGPLELDLVWVAKYGADGE